MHLMKKLFLLPLLILAFNFAGCAGMSTTTKPASAVASAQTAAQQSLYAIGTALQAAPAVMDALYNAGKMSKVDYNNAVPIYNQALWSFKLAVSALNAVVDAEQDPTQVSAYVKALSDFLGDKAIFDELLGAYGSVPVGAVVK
jgi:PBP1b-binding outer membrane lipoprotein LpoB